MHISNPKKFHFFQISSSYPDPLEVDLTPSVAILSRFSGSVLSILFAVYGQMELLEPSADEQNRNNAKLRFNQPQVRLMENILKNK